MNIKTEPSQPLRNHATDSKSSLRTESSARIVSNGMINPWLGLNPTSASVKEEKDSKKKRSKVAESVEVEYETPLNPMFRGHSVPTHVTSGVPYSHASAYPPPEEYFPPECNPSVNESYVNPSHVSAHFPTQSFVPYSVSVPFPGPYAPTYVPPNFAAQYSVPQPIQGIPYNYERSLQKYPYHSSHTLPGSVLQSTTQIESRKVAPPQAEPRMALAIGPNGIAYYYPVPTPAPPVILAPPPRPVKSEPDEMAFSDDLFTIGNEERQQIDAERKMLQVPKNIYPDDKDCSGSVMSSLSGSSSSSNSRNYKRDREERETEEQRDARYDQFNEQRVQQLLPPKIYKTDIRRQYPRMLGNILNSFDIGLMTSFHHQLATPDIIYSMTISGPPSNADINTILPPSVPKATHVFPPINPADLICTFQLQGRDLLTTYWSGVLQIAPDYIMEMNNIQIITQYGSLKCKLAFDFRATASKIYAIRLDKMVEDIIGEFNDSLHVADKDAGSSKDSSVASNASEDPLRSYCYQDAYTRDIGDSILPYRFDAVQTFRRRRNGIMPAVNPVYLDARGKYIIHINEQKLIEKIEVQCELNTIAPTNYHGPKTK